MTRAPVAPYGRVLPGYVRRARAAGGRRPRIKRPNPMMLLVVARIAVAAVVAVAIALAVGGPVNWRQALGGLLPGWPWW